MARRTCGCVRDVLVTPSILGCFPKHEFTPTPSRRYLDVNSLSGSLPSQLGVLTALTFL